MQRVSVATPGGIVNNARQTAARWRNKIYQSVEKVGEFPQTVIPAQAGIQ
jgi:hypothetical protein